MWFKYEFNFLLINIHAFLLEWLSYRTSLSVFFFILPKSKCQRKYEHSTCTVHCYHTLLKIETYIHSTFHTDYNGPLVLFSKMCYKL